MGQKRNYRTSNKTIASTALIFIVVLAILLPLVSASTEASQTKPAAMRAVSNIEGSIAVEPKGAFDLSPEAKANMSQKELFALQGIPGYFTPKQTTLQGTMLDSNPEVINAVVVVDEEYRAYLAYYVYHCPPEFLSWNTVYACANNVLEGGDDYLETNFGIDVQQTISTHWQSPNGLGLVDLLYQIDGVDPTGVDCDIIILMTGQSDPAGNTGATTILWRWMVMKPDAGMPMNLFQHELSHLFGCPDHGLDFGRYCIMSYAYEMITQSYCSDCVASLNHYKYRFDAANARQITIQSSTGGTTYPEPGTYSAAWYPYINVMPDNGWAFTAWEITADGNTWTESPWNPVEVIYDYATVRPIFEYTG